MSTTTSIEWTDVTWNPVRGCSLVSPGCANCYAMKQAHRFSGTGKPYEGLTEIGPHGPRWTGKIRVVPEALEEPLHWTQPRLVFVNSMSDLFHEDVPDEFVHHVFGTIRRTPQHTYQILTKRPDRMREFIVNYLRPREAMGWANGFYSHVWLGVSIENQATADERIPILLQTPAAVRWISAEPLLGPVKITEYLRHMDWDEMVAHQNETGHENCESAALHWVVVGGESGPGARPCDLQSIRFIAAQCMAAGVPVFVKQLGSRWYDVAARCGIKGSCVVPIDSPWTWVTQQDRKGGDMTDPEFPEDLKVRQYPR